MAHIKESQDLSSSPFTALNWTDIADRVVAKLKPNSIPFLDNSTFVVTVLQGAIKDAAVENLTLVSKHC